MKKFFSLSILTLLFLLSVQDVSTAANSRPLEVDYPLIQEAPILTTVEGTNLTQYIKYVFYFALAISGIIALISLIWAGFIYLTSAGSVEKMTDAKSRMGAAFLGLVILFGSWMILYTINPQFTELKIKELNPTLPPQLNSGVYLCKSDVDLKYYWEQIEELQNADVNIQRQRKQGLVNLKKSIDANCWFARTGNIPQNFENITKYAHVIPSITYKRRFGAILYNESATNQNNSKAQIIYETELEPGSFEIYQIQASSIKLFSLINDPSNSWYVELFELSGQLYKDEKGMPKMAKKYNLASLISPCYDIDEDFPKIPGTRNESPHQFQSIKFEGNLMAVFFRNDGCEEEWLPITELYPINQNDFLLNDNMPLGRWCQQEIRDENNNLIRIDKYPCAKSMVIIAIEML